MPTVDAPRAVRALTGLLVATAAATAVVELLNWWYGARPLGLILAVTTVFAVGRLIVPREGVPPLPGVVGFAVLTALCVAIVVLLYRHPSVTGHLVRHPHTLIATRRGVEWREATPRRPPVAGWLITARVAAFTYGPLVLVPCLIAVGELADRPQYLLAVLFWFVLGFGVSYLVLLTTFFMLRGKAWARRLMIWVTLGVVVLDLPLCWLLLGVDGLVRDGAPLVAAATLTLYGLWRARRAEAPAPDLSGVGTPA